MQIFNLGLELYFHKSYLRYVMDYTIRIWILDIWLPKIFGDTFTIEKEMQDYNLLIIILQ